MNLFIYISVKYINKTDFSLITCIKYTACRAMQPIRTAIVKSANAFECVYIANGYQIGWINRVLKIYSLLMMLKSRRVHHPTLTKRQLMTRLSYTSFPNLIKTKPHILLPFLKISQTNHGALSKLDNMYYVMTLTST
jgi:hypothetical protein